MDYRVTSLEDAIEALEYFNYFHDGFIKRLTLISHDAFDENKGQLCSGKFDVEIDFAHYNYAQGVPPYDQLIAAHFYNVKDVMFDFRGMTFEWAINTCSIVAAARQDHYGHPEPCLALVLSRNHLDESRQWTIKEGRLFTFTYATFIEEGNVT